MHDRLIWFGWALGFALSICLVQFTRVCWRLHKRQTNIEFNLAVGCIFGIISITLLQAILFALINEAK